MVGIGGGIFFLGYFLFEVPSNLILNKVGARIWIARVMVTWGLVSAASAFVVGPNSFYTLRFLLGVAEPVSSPASFFISASGFPRGNVQSRRPRSLRPRPLRPPSHSPFSG